MSRSRLCVPAGLLVLVIQPAIASAQPDDDPAVLRDRVLKANSSREAGDAYQAYFLRLGLAAVRERQKDEDTGIALQAAWEAHKKAVKRPKEIPGRTNDVYDPDELAKFVTFLKERTKAPVPDWWAESIVNVDLFPGRHHAFIGASGPKRVRAKAGAFVPEGAELEEKGDALVYTASGRPVAFPKDTFKDDDVDSYAGALGEKRSVVAAYTAASGFSFSLAGFEGRGGKPDWKVDVWAAARDGLAGLGFHHVELTTKEDTVFVFGGESHAMYVEAFDMTTGKCRYRFCTRYWSNSPEMWGLK